MSNYLITGGAGYFGRGMVKHLLVNGANKVCVYSRDEWKHAQLKAEIQDPRLRFFVGDVRDKDRLTRAFEGIDIVYHAAALKRVDSIEYNPQEAVKTNIMGSMNVIDAAIEQGVHKVVALSTDKACAPVNAYGASKLMLEKLFIATGKARGSKPTLFSVCRYGNVAGSTGSVIPIWRRMISSGATSLPVTHPDCTRFYMTLDQAVALVSATGATEESGNLVVPDLPAYRLEDLCLSLNCSMDIIGLKPEEKMHEEMVVGETSEFARRMSVDELREALKSVPI